ncbi:MAG: ribosome-associated translation inhibitor RaiA [Planctomycetota bacterium]|nr:MAG: ribosome-associated translation inhibitor RaiA [Planctomycetota bacterium]
MQINVSGRHMNVGDALREYCEKKASKIGRFYDRIQSIDVVVDGHNGQHSVEMIVHSDGTQPFVASEEREDAFAAVDVLVDKIERQLKRHKERLRNRKHPPQAPPATEA